MAAAEHDDKVRLWRMPTLGEQDSVEHNALGDVQTKRSTGHLTAEALQAIREQARQEGLEQGLKEGRQTGEKQAREELKKELQSQFDRYHHQFETLFNALQKPLADRDDETEQALAELAFSVAKQVIRRELRTNPGEIVAVVREAVALLPMNQQTIRIRLHPEDAAFIRKVFAMEQSDSREWQISEDPSMQRGGCKVTTDDSAIDASIDARVAGIVAHVLGGDRASDDS